MTDRERAIAALERAGYIRCDDDGVNWEHPANDGDGVTLWEDGRAYVTMTVPYAIVPALLSRLQQNGGEAK